MSLECTVVARVQIANSARTVSKFFFHIQKMCAKHRSKVRPEPWAKSLRPVFLSGNQTRLAIVEKN